MHECHLKRNLPSYFILGLLSDHTEVRPITKASPATMNEPARSPADLGPAVCSNANPLLCAAPDELVLDVGEEDPCTLSETRLVEEAEDAEPVGTVDVVSELEAEGSKTMREVAVLTVSLSPQPRYKVSSLRSRDIDNSGGVCEGDNGSVTIIGISCKWKTTGIDCQRSQGEGDHENETHDPVGVGNVLARFVDESWEGAGEDTSHCCSSEMVCDVRARIVLMLKAA
jgi:hypothetical protein